MSEHTPDKPNYNVVFERLSEVSPERIDWIIPGWLAAGEFHLLAGQAGMGKSTLAYKLAALISTGQNFPGPAGDLPCRQGTVLIWSGEDDLRRIVRPRLDLAGADLQHVFHISRPPGKGEFNPAEDIPELNAAMRNTRTGRLLILDPVLEAAGHARDSNRATDIRNALRPLIQLARERGIAVLGITHFLKSTSGAGDPLDRVIGSQAWGAVARIVMAVSRQDDGSRVLMRAKSNLGSSDGGVEYKLQEGLIPLPGQEAVSTVKAEFGNLVAGEAADVFADAAAGEEAREAASAKASAKEWLLEALAADPDGGASWEDLQKRGHREGHSAGTLRRARDEMRIRGQIARRRARGATGSWTWRQIDLLTPPE